MIYKIDPFNFPACRISKSLPYGVKNLEKCTLPSRSGGQEVPVSGPQVLIGACG